MKFHLDIRATIDIDGTHVDPLDFENRVELTLQDYRDGRYDFSVEQVNEGLSQIVKHVVESTVRAPFYERHQNKMVAGKVVAHHLAQKAMETVTSYTQKSLHVVKVSKAPCDFEPDGEHSHGSYGCGCDRAKDTLESKAISDDEVGTIQAATAMPMPRIPTIERARLRNEWEGGPESKNEPGHSAATAERVIKDLADGLRLLRTSDGVELSEDAILERAKNLAMTILGNYHVEPMED